MADLRITPAVPSAIPSAPAASARSEAVRAAQRAFFQAAVNPPSAPQTLSRATAAPVPARSAPSAAPIPEEPRSPRVPRPGSYVDIKV